MSEIREAKPKALNNPWIAADAGIMPFMSSCFDNATMFFSCMYMPDPVKKKVFRETKRVLKKGGELWIWGTRMSEKEKVFAVRMQTASPATSKISTIYGVGGKDQSSDSICKLLQSSGFSPEIISDQKHRFFIRAAKL